MILIGIITFFLGFSFALFIHRLLYFIHIKDKKDLLYCLLAISVIFWFFCKALFPKLFEDHVRLHSILVNISVFFVVFFVNYFTYFIIHKKKLKLIMILFAVFNIIPCITALCFNFNPKLSGNIYIILSSPFIIFSPTYMIILFIKEKIHKTKSITLFYYSVIIFAISFAIYPLLSILGIDPLFQVTIVGLGLLFMKTVSSSAYIENYKELNQTLEQKVIDRTADLNNALKSKSNFLVNIAHEFKTPLHLLKDNFVTFLTLRPEFKKDEHLQIAHRQIDLLNRYSSNTFDIEKGELNRKLYSNDCLTNLSTIVKDKSKLFRIHAKKKNIQLFDNVEKDIIIRANPQAIDRVLNNLLDNSIKFTPSGGHINIILTSMNDQLDLTIEDNGRGIKQEDYKHIFTPYYQSSRNKQVSEGLGLGLSIVNQIIKEIGGTILPSPGEQNGLKMTIQLDRYTGKEKAQKHEINSPICQTIHTVEDTHFKDYLKTILIVEDNPEMLKSFKEHLQDEYNIITATNGHHALNRINHILPDLIISDLMMPDLDGYGLLKQIPDKASHIPFLIVTAKNIEENKIKGLTMGAMDYIYKPFNFREIQLKVAALLKRSDQISNSELENLQEALKIVRKNKKNPFKLRAAQYGLTPTEKEVVLLLNEGLVTKEIAVKRFCTVYTIKEHIQNIYNKTGFHEKEKLLDILFN